MAASQVVVRYRDGRLVKGTTSNFLPARDCFHVQTPEGEVVAVAQDELKALFFVREFAGDPTRKESSRFSATRPALGRKIRVVFADGEEIVGTTQGYQPNRPGFFVFPADAGSNNERCFVITAATRRVSPV
jgi:small nuclear ribonucleoprotein (snRNP)-like protein